MNSNSYSPPKQTQHVYLSAIRDLQAADAEENLKKKREQQYAFAESLKRQIEEKQRLKKQMNNHASTQPPYRETYQRNEPHSTFGDDNFENWGINNQKISKNSRYVDDDSLAFDDFQQKTSNYAPSKLPRKQILTKADLSQFDHCMQMNPRKENIRYNQNPIQINTDSPFASSTVTTPPQGFSMRKTYGMAQTQKISENSSFASMYDNPNDNYYSILSGTVPKPKPKQELFPNNIYSTAFDNSKPLNTSNIKYNQLSNTISPNNLPKKNYRPPQPQPRSKSVLLMPVDSTNAQQLGGYSELIYPDGHLSPAVSPREF